MDAPAELLANLLDAGGTICVDLACRRCGYNLRGLNPAGRCPECGTPVGLSCQGDLLRFSDPAWVELLARGVRLILWGILAAIVAGVLGAVVGAAGAGPLMVTGVSFLGALVGFYGAWLVTQPDPSGIGEDKYVTDRKIVRFSLLVGLASQPLNVVNELMPLAYGLRILLTAMVVLIGLVALVGQFAQLTYFQKLALRIPDPALATRARALRWGLAISLGVLVLGGGLMAIALSSKPGGGTSVALSSGPGGTVALAPGTASSGLNMGVIGSVCVMGVAGLAYLVVGLLILSLMSRLGKAFREQAHLARATWAAATS